MSLERWIRLIAGTFIITSVALSYFHSRYWLWFTLLVGVNLFQSALTGWCLMEDLLRKFGVGQLAASRHVADAHREERANVADLYGRTRH